MEEEGEKEEEKEEEEKEDTSESESRILVSSGRSFSSRSTG